LGVKIAVVEDRDTKQLLGGILVRGAGRIHRADKILLLLGNENAYKENLDFMKYLDAGVLAMNIYLACEVKSIGTCFVNPNIREEHKHIFRDIVKEEGVVLCGAMPIGHYDKHPEDKEIDNFSDILYTDETSSNNTEL
jgi:nitroreductase